LYRIKLERRYSEGQIAIEKIAFDKEMDDYDLRKLFKSRIAEKDEAGNQLQYTMDISSAASKEKQELLLIDFITITVSRLYLM